MNNKFEILRPWLKDILISIKKDLKMDYLPGDKIFYKKYFGNRPLNRLTNEEIFEAVEKELIEGNDSLGEWAINRWVFNHGDIYTHFAEKLGQIRPDFNELSELTQEESEEILKGAESFGAIDVYLFAQLNEVVFPAKIFELLKGAALSAKETFLLEEASKEEKLGLEQIIERQQREIIRIQEKCENKIAGVLRKYQTDTEALKAQIRALQKKLSVG
ncbi:MAG: hypothetical protein K2X08_03875 [Chlamydiales bacterium]|nr:hypothetical protein [Chlamydiales bacterium]